MKKAVVIDAATAAALRAFWRKNRQAFVPLTAEECKRAGFDGGDLAYLKLAETFNAGGVHCYRLTEAGQKAFHREQARAAGSSAGRIVRVPGLALLAAAAFLAVARPADAHDWYPLACCSQKDCWPSPPGNITVTPEGYRIGTSGEVIPFDDPRIKPTPPEGGGDFHVCHLAADPTARALCLFVPEVGA